MTEPEDPTRLESARRPLPPSYPAPAYGAVLFHDVWVHSGRLCLECSACSKRAVFTKTDLPRSRLGPVRYVLHARFKCTKCSSTDARLWRATMAEAELFLAGDPLPANKQIGR